VHPSVVDQHYVDADPDTCLTFRFVTAPDPDPDTYGTYRLDADSDPDPIPSFKQVGKSLHDFYSQQCQFTLFYLYFIVNGAIFFIF
jgi:hypothetical protein